MSGMMGGGAAWRHLRSDRSVVHNRIERGTVRRVLAFARPHRRLIAVFLVLTVIDAGLVVVSPLLAQRIIDDGIVAGDRQRRVLEAKAKARGIAFEAMEQLAFSSTSIKSYVTPRQLADYAVFTASPRARTVSGQALSVCGDTNMLS